MLDGEECSYIGFGGLKVEGEMDALLRSYEILVMISSISLDNVWQFIAN
jgi:hypothetical protein